MLTSATQCEAVVGTVTHVRDGDAIEVGGLPIRLEGLAAPERDEPDGTRAARAMRQMVDGRELRCELNGDRTRDRCVGICYLEGRDVAKVLVRMGLARDRPRFSGGRRYREAELEAGEEGATIRGSYQLPGYCR